MPSGAVIRYAYDNKNNITHVYENDVLKIRYTYDAIGQLTREDNAYSNKSYLYNYDSNGNRTTSYTYSCSFENSLTGMSGFSSLVYSDSEWGDLLTQVNGVNLSYDAIGNPLSYYNGNNYTMTWENGRRLASVTKGGVTTSYGYNADGIRTSKTVDGTTTYFVLDGDRIIFEGNFIEYYYDESGAPVGIKYNGYTYYFIKNLQGDVVAIYDNTGTCVVEYLYDAWGKVLSITGSKADTLGIANPFRYRGYYYDNETGFYYLKSRYYDPSIGRFINADGYTSAGQELLSNNMFAYCNNNAPNMADYIGEDAIWLHYPESAKENGHASLLIQNASGEWFFFYWGAKSTSDRVELVLGTEAAYVFENVGEGEVSTLEEAIALASNSKHSELVEGIEDYIYIEGDFCSSFDYINDLEDKQYRLLSRNCVQVCTTALSKGTFAEHSETASHAMYNMTRYIMPNQAFKAWKHYTSNIDAYMDAKWYERIFMPNPFKYIPNG